MKSSGTFPQLETKRLILREIGLQDAEGVFQNFSDEEITDIIGMGSLSTLKDAEEIIGEFQAYFEKGTGLAWAVVLKENDRFIGICTYEELDKHNSRGEIGYDLLRDYWGKGLMSEALRAVISYGFEELELNRIDAHTFLLTRNHEKC
ncbi:MAG: GNAT family N-acetyltransferase [Candidatus Thorarchaeota archaeon]|nr:GNAT family N-acetyltransferase [Candidatus Thorarchaeota archaeon]